jgi:protein-disulfide isomerase
MINNHSLSEDINQKIKNFILNNPQVIIESLNNFEEKKEDERRIENNKKVENFKESIFKSNFELYEGKSSAKKVIVEFFDYNCSYCKRVHNDLKKILSKSDDLKIIYKNFPILSEDSVKLAKYAIILSEIDNKKFIDFHNFVISNKGQLKDKDLDKLFMKLNVVRDEVDKKLNDSSVLKILKNDIQLAQNLGLRGTPAFIINNEIIFGYINYEDMLSKLN